MIEQLTHVMVQSGAAWVLWLLFGLSIISLAIGLERAWVLRAARGDTALLVKELRRCLRNEDPRRARQLLDGDKNVAASIVAAGLAEADLGAAAAEEAMAAAAGLERSRLEKRLLFLGTVGNNAPFVGLLGTVIGIVGAFEELGKPQAMTAVLSAATSLAPERVMATIAEALVATAVGLLVAIPAVAAFNALQARVSAVLADAETLGHVLLSHLKADNDRGARTRERRDSGEEPSRHAAE
jgi:biopolymer transport protein ExbB/TolQ